MYPHQPIIRLLSIGRLCFRAYAGDGWVGLEMKKGKKVKKIDIIFWGNSVYFSSLHSLWFTFSGYYVAFILSSNLSIISSPGKPWKPTNILAVGEGVSCYKLKTLFILGCWEPSICPNYVLIYCVNMTLSRLPSLAKPLCLS